MMRFFHFPVPKWLVIYIYFRSWKFEFNKLDLKDSSACISLFCDLNNSFFKRWNKCQKFCWKKMDKEMQIYFIATLTVTVLISLFITTSSDVSELNIYRALYHRLALLWISACFTVATIFNFTFQYKQIYESSLLYIYIYCKIICTNDIHSYYWNNKNC